MTTYTSPQDGTTLDTFVTTADTAANYSANASLFVGCTSSGYKYRSFFQFPGLTDGSIPKNAIIMSAKLHMQISKDSSDNARTFRVYRSKRNVVISQCTWAIYSTGKNWQTAGGFGANDCEQTDIGSCAFSSSESVGTWKEFSLTPSAIQDIVNGVWATPTFLIKADTESTDRYGFYSTNDATSTNRPYIVVEYLLGGQVIIWSSE